MRIQLKVEQRRLQQKIFEIIGFFILIIVGAFLLIAKKYSVTISASNSPAIFLIIAATYLTCMAEIILGCLTSLWRFLIASFFLNSLFSILIAANFSPEDKSVLWIASFLFGFLFCSLSLISNTKVAKTANTIIEIILAILSLTKVLVSYGIDSNVILKLTATTDEVINNEEAAVLIKDTFLTAIDYALFLPLLINGVCLILCEIHAYWIEKYNDNKEVTWDRDKMKEYTENPKTI